MNIAGPTIVILCLLLPGMGFRRFYYSGAFSKQYTTEDLGRLVLRTAFLALLIHFLAASVFWILSPELLDGYRIAVDGAFGSKDGSIVEAFSTWPDRRGFFAAYGAVVILGCLAGYTTQYLVQRWRLDRRFKLLRYRNYWHYLLRGGVRDFSGVTAVLGADKGDVAVTYVDAVVTSSEGDLIYNGLLVDYELGSDGELGTLVLASVSRRSIRDDYDAPQLGSDDNLARDRPTRFYEVLGDLVVVPAREIRNYNIRYVTVVDIEVAANELVVSINDADGDITSAAYYGAPNA